MINHFKIILIGLLLGMPVFTYADSIENEKKVAEAISATTKTEELKAEALKSEELKKEAVKAVVDASKKEIKTKPEEKLAQIEVTGVDSELKKNIELQMPVTIPVCNAERGEVKQFFTNVKKRLRKASRALGYYDAEFRTGGKIVKGCWKLRLRITPGRVTKVVSQTVNVVGEGSQQKIFKKILEKKPYEKGDPLNHKNYSDYKTQLSEAAQSLGYFNAEFEQHSIKVNPLAHQASVSLVLNTGTRYRYGKVTVDQNILSDKVMQEFLTIKEGEPYETEALIKQQQYLQSSGYYKLIKIDVLHDQAKNNRVPIVITLKAKKRNNYKFKIGYGSDTGARVSVIMKRRWTGNKGKEFIAEARYAQNLSKLSLKLTDPQKNPDDDVVVYHIDLTQDKNDDLTSRSIDIGGEQKRKLSNDWLQKSSLSLLLDRTRVDGESENKTRYLLFGVGLEKTKTDNLLYPSNGWHLRYSVTGAVRGLLSDQNVLQFEALAKKILPLGEGRLLTRLQIGTTLVDEFDDLPKRLRFFAGGGSSIRGYGFESLGVVKEIDGEDKVIGGRQLLNLSLEYQHPITDEWSAAAFVDAGNAFDDWGDYDVKVGLGFGARYRSPIGPVRIDIGFPQDDFNDPHLYLSIGSDL